MPRKPNPDLTRPWKLNLPATLAGKVEYLLHDPIHQKARYGVRGYLIERLLNCWLASVEGNHEEAAKLPTLDEVRNAKS